MFQRGIRGAITVDSNSAESVKDATVELLREIISENSVDTENISHVIFTLTKDIDSAFPAKFAREELDWPNVPMMCFNELDVDGAIASCLRVLVVVNTEKTQVGIKHIYLKDAKKLRPDID